MIDRSSLWRGLAWVARAVISLDLASPRERTRSRRLTAMTALGLAMLVVLVLVALLAPELAPYRPHAFVAPSLLAPSAKHLLGTTETGQDIFSQLIAGTRDALVVAPPAAGLTIALGTGVGMAAGLLGGWLDPLLTRLADATLALPKLPLLILIAVAAGSSRTTIVISVGAVAWPMSARIVRAQTLSLRNRDYVSAARSFGAGPLYLARRHLVPALAPVLVAGFVSVASAAILLESGLAFLGLSDPTQVSWGAMIDDALNYSGLYFGHSWLWWMLPPSLAITFAVLAFTLVGVGLESRLHPRLDQHLA